MAGKNKKRLLKFQKIVALGQRQLDLIQLELAQKQSERTRLNEKAEQFEAELGDIQNQPCNTLELTSSRQLAAQLMLGLQKRINELHSEINILGNEIQEVLKRFQQQNTKVKSWEKLVDRMRDSIREEDDKRELVIADDRYLATTPPGRIR